MKISNLNIVATIENENSRWESVIDGCIKSRVDNNWKSALDEAVKSGKIARKF